MDFLTIETNLMPDNNYEMKIVFAGDSMIKVISEVIEVTLDDQGELGIQKICQNTRLL